MFIVVLPTVIASLFIFDAPWYSFFPLVAAAMIALGYAAILHYLVLEAGLRPVLLDINHSLPPRLQTECSAVPLRYRLLAVMPLINMITGVVVAALTSEDSRHRQPRRRRADRARGRDDDLARAHRAAVEVDPAPGRRPPQGDPPGRRGPLRRGRGAGDHRRRARRAGGVVQPDGRRPARARAHPRGLRHLPRPRGRRVHPQRGLLRGGGRARGLDDVLRRARLHRVRRRSQPEAGRRARSTACSRSSSRSSPATAATSTSSRATACWRSSARPSPTATTPTARCAPRARSPAASTTRARRASFGSASASTAAG